MKPVLALLAILAVAACREEVAAIPDPVPMTEEAVGHYCQMDLLEHPGPKAQVHLDGQPGMPLFFSQVRDAVAYQRMPEQSHAITAIYVSDMANAPSWEDPGATNWVRADLAHYVVGATIPGGMGAPELVPFSRPEAAAEFAARHGGAVMALAAIDDAQVLAPVEPALDENGDFIAPAGATDH
jgi:copper chaperone NosL